MNSASIVLLALAVVLFLLAALLPRKIGSEATQSLITWGLFCWSLSMLVIRVGERW